MPLSMLCCKECGHTFKLPYRGIHDTHSCAEHEAKNYPHHGGCRKCAANTHQHGPRIEHTHDPSDHIARKRGQS